jgi:2-hydroxychromene-2-carboxylate isomerase
MTPGTTFYYDLGSPYSYLTAERIAEVLPGEVTWQPVSLGGLFKANGRSSWSLGDPERRRGGIAEIERRAHEYGLPPLRWPDPWPTNYLFAMRVATYAFTRERGREFTMCAFRGAFQQGHDLGVRENVLRAAAAAGLDPDAAASAAGEDAIKQTLRAATDAAHELGVFGVPTIATAAGELFWGDDRLGAAAVALQAPG